MIQAPFSAEELAAKESFQNYCLRTEESSTTYWENWGAENPEQAETVQLAKQLVQQFALQPQASEVEEALATFQTKMAAPKPKGGKQISLWIQRLAAVFMLGLFAFGAWHYMQPDWKHIQTAFGKTQHIHLAEGSEITLNANSSIRYQANLEERPKREVWLQGEGFFDIKQNGKPFIVHTDRGDIRVLGTSFNVEQRSEYLNVSLIEGRIQLELPNYKPFEVKPHTTIVFGADNKILSKKADEAAELAWKENTMLFRNTKIADLMQQLKAEFDINLRVEANSLLERNISASIQERNPEVLLEALAEIYELELQKVDAKTYVLK